MISIVVPAYNEAEYLPETLRRARAAAETYAAPYELIAVDNNSTDATAQVAADAGARVVFEPINQISRARDAGAKAASGEYLLFVDADTWLSPDVYRRAMEHLAAGACGGGSRVDFDRPLPWSASAFTAFWNALAPKLGYAAGSFVFCRRDAFEEIGGFGDRFYASEEIHFSRALNKWGKARGKPFRVITEFAVVTSGRKLEWFSQGRLILTLLVLAFLPFLTRSRLACSVWYKRPKQKI